MKTFYIKIIALIIITGVVLLSFVPLFNSLKFGLDLQGGFEVLYQVSPIEGDNLTRDMLTNTYRTIGRRIDVLGVTEPEIIIEGNDRIRVRLAGIEDQAVARDILSRTASLTFRDSSDNLLMTSDVLSNATLDQDEYGRPAVALRIRDNDTFFRETRRISNSEDQLIVIWLDYEEGIDSYENEIDNCGSFSDSKCLSAATVSQGFAGNVIIRGSFTREEASTLSELINSGSIPTNLTEISSKTVGASFGENSLNRTLIAGVVGILLVILIMIYIYRFAGIITSAGIILYTFLTFLIFYSIGGVLTLPGIAALVLGIGMAVDANVINYEAMKEELKEGNDIKTSFKNAHKRSFLTIFDANVTTFIVAIILFIFGESTVKGFATMLIINIFVTIVIMVFLVKYILNVFINTNYFKDKKSLFINFKEKKKETKNFEFLKLGKYFIAFSSIIIAVGCIFLFTIGFNLGIDYRGGSSITIISNDELEINKIKADINDLGYTIVDIDTIDSNSVYIKIEDVLEKEQIDKTDKYFQELYDAQTEIGVISDIVKRELTANAIYSVILAAIGIIIYVALRFKFSYAISGVIALFHDVFIVIAIFAIFRLEVNAIFIAAILTIFGYSINDTIVIFDRVRESINKLIKNNSKNKEKLYDVINIALKHTLKRTLYTTITVFVVVASLIFLGAYEIINFNLALLVGVAAGTYSSLFIAAPICYKLLKNNLNKPQKKKKNIDEIDEISVKGINS